MKDVAEVVALNKQPGQAVVYGSAGRVDELAAIMIRYPVASGTVCQLKLAGIETPVAPSEGETSCGEVSWAVVEIARGADQFPPWTALNARTTHR